MKEHLPFCREFSILFIGARVVVDHVFYPWKRKGSEGLSFLKGSGFDP